MITANENIAIESIKRAALRGEPVSAQQKQWVLDIVAREQVTVPLSAIDAAYLQGYNTKGIMVDCHA